MISVNQVIFNNLCKGLKYNKAFATNFWAMAPRSGGGGVQRQDSRSALRGFGGSGGSGSICGPLGLLLGGRGIDLTPCVPNFGSFMGGHFIV